MRSLQAELAKLKKELKKRGVGAELVEPITIGPGAMCTYYNINDAKPFIEEFYERTGTTRKDFPDLVVFGRFCPHSKEPIKRHIGMEKTCLKEKCEWYEAKHLPAHDLVKDLESYN